MRPPAQPAPGACMRTPHLLATHAAAGDPEGPYRHAELALWDELMSSFEGYPRSWLSLEEGAWVLGEEVDELWDEVRHNRIGCARAEAVQVAAMAVRFIADLYEPAGSVRERCRVALVEQRGLRTAVGPAGRVLSSTHEAFGFVKREFDSLWSAICFRDVARPAAGRVAAASVRFVAEITPVSAAVGGLSL